MSDLISGGLLAVLGAGVWRGQVLMSQALEHRREMDMTRLQLERQEASVRLEMEQTRNLAEIERMQRDDRPALGPGAEGGPAPAPTPAAVEGVHLICDCALPRLRGVLHLHVMAPGNVPTELPLSVGAVASLLNGDVNGLCCCPSLSTSVHRHTDTRTGRIRSSHEALHARGYTMCAPVHRWG